MLGFIETEEIRSDGNVVKHYHVVSELLNGVSLADVLEGKVDDCHGNEVPYARKSASTTSASHPNTSPRLSSRLFSRASWRSMTQGISTATSTPPTS